MFQAAVSLNYCHSCKQGILTHIKSNQKEKYSIWEVEALPEIQPPHLPKRQRSPSVHPASRESIAQHDAESSSAHSCNTKTGSHTHTLTTCQFLSNNTIISPPARVVRSAAIRQGNGYGTSVISQDTVCHVNTICVFCTNFSCVCPGTCALRTKTFFLVTCKAEFSHVFYDITFWMASK